ncbi:MAG: hypothetical protein K2N69_01185, partial [Helicobacter sp.]|nr:hypothetical protein [Helicobacter sp.]
VRCGWENRIMSNGESKIAESKAALCYGFAIALRALFLGILCWGILCRLIATLTLAMTRSSIRGATKAHALRHCEHTTYAYAFSRTHKIVNEGAPNRPLGV